MSNWVQQGGEVRPPACKYYYDDYMVHAQQEGKDKGLLVLPVTTDSMIMLCRHISWCVSTHTTAIHLTWYNSSTKTDTIVLEFLTTISKISAFLFLISIPFPISTCLQWWYTTTVEPLRKKGHQHTNHGPQLYMERCTKPSLKWGSLLYLLSIIINMYTCTWISTNTRTHCSKSTDRSQTLSVGLNITKILR